MGEQHAQVAVTALGDVAERAAAAGGIFLGCEAEPAGEVAGILEVFDVAAGDGNHGGGSEQADTGDRQQSGAGRAVLSHVSQFAFQLNDARFEQANFFDGQFHSATYQRGNSGMRIGQNTADLFQAVTATSRNGNTEFPTETAQCVDTRGAGAHPQGAGAMQPLLLNRLGLDGCDVGAASGFEQGTGIGGIDLVALDVGADVGGRQQLDGNAQGIELARPVVSQTTDFHDDEGNIAIDEPALELATGQAVLFNDVPGGIGS